MNQTLTEREVMASATHALTDALTKFVTDFDENGIVSPRDAAVMLVTVATQLYSAGCGPLATRELLKRLLALVEQQIASAH